jgi:hypothetical protein
MNFLRTVALLAFCVVPLACRSTDKSHEAAQAAPCTCGTPAADFEGCTHPACMHGERNPANPDCVCGTLSIPKTK